MTSSLTQTDSSTPPSPPNDIDSVTRACLQSFEGCLSVAILRRDEWAENRLAEFNFWIASVGALAPLKAGLDHRLQIANEIEVHFTIVQLLNLLNKFLENCYSIAKPFHRQQGAPVPDDDKSVIRKEVAWELELAVQDVDSILEQLASLAVAIRRSGSNSRMQKADRTFDPNKHQELRNHLTLLITFESPKKIEMLRTGTCATHREPNPPTTGLDLHLDVVQTRLINANLRRRHRFLYAQTHATKLERQAVKHESSIREEASRHAAQAMKVPETTSQNLATDPPNPAQTAHISSKDRKGVLTDTTASEVVDSIRDIRPKQATPSQQARSEISTTASKIVYPTPPRIDPRPSSFRCPCCCLPLLSDIAIHSNKWRNHIAEDLSPYTCVLEACPQPDATYVTRRSWAEHMYNDHQGLQVWECIICDLPTHFYDAVSFQSHLSDQHRGAVKDTESFAAACMTNAPPMISSCPLCSWAEDQTDAEDTAALIDHIAEHVHSFSLRSLPWASATGTIHEEAANLESHAYIPSAGNSAPLTRKYFSPGEKFGGGAELPAEGIARWLSNIPSTHGTVQTIQDTAADARPSLEKIPEDFTANLRRLLDSALGTSKQPWVQDPASGEYDYFILNEYFGEDAEDSVVASGQHDDQSESDSYLSTYEPLSTQEHLDKKAEELKVGEIERQKRELGEEHPVTLASMANLALTYSNQRRWKEAEELEVLVLETRKRVLGAEHPHTLNSVDNLATVLADQGNYEAAEKLDRQALSARERILGKEHPDTLSSVNSLATVLADQGKYEEAEKLDRRALKAREKILGKEHPDTLSSVNSLATMLADQGKYEEAEKLRRQALSAGEKILGIEHPETLSSISSLASVLRYQGKYEEAEKLDRQALNTREKILGIEHPDTLSSISNLARMLGYQGKYEEAEKLYRRALGAREKVLGMEQPDTLSSISNLASVLRYQGKYEEAEKLDRQALNTREKILGKEHPDTLSSVNSLATVLADQGKYDEAEMLDRRVLSAGERILGIEHSDTLSSISNLASVLSCQGKYEEAEKFYRRALRAREKVLGMEHPGTLSSVKSLAHMLQREDQFEEALILYQRALSGREKTLGREHPETFSSVHDLAALFHERLQYQDALPLYQRACAGFEKTLGSDNPRTRDCAKRYSKMIDEMRDSGVENASVGTDVDPWRN